MATDRVDAALRLAQSEAAAGGLSAEVARQLLEAVTGDAAAVPVVHPRGRSLPALADRDEAVTRMADLLSARSTWAVAGRVADWLRRWHSGDALSDAPAEAAALCAAIGKPLSPRQVFRILCGSRSG